MAAAVEAVKATGVEAAAAASLAVTGVAPFHYPGTTVLGTYLISNTVAAVGRYVGDLKCLATLAIQK